MGSVCFSIDYSEENKQIELNVYDKPYRFKDKKVVVKKLFDYEIVEPNFRDTHNIVAMIEKFLIERYY